ncbi:helix-turn-helix domain-containing protein [Actinoalloteichus hymeniacidonis]|uniref:Transcriptional regulator n=1 Tax=Actinoalloteichus hymeniacidonis TaxID=340345 RepID=A0AAC9MZ95_9PSEU|nr:MerR family transcriptional regulator [Actinoalloteichus hymeniacidonis]AOS63827.1 putative transcriptional regulator [Actinoalloteichus hymeniacidonis]MBB5908118.1 DNA-binding transcriptional MerR regulator [Actinoalloteichus hymeniacidonis]
MTWSTRQLAELADTTVNAVRHYHKIGLLDEPERTSNGYKHYTVSHLVRLLQIKRMSALGIPLGQVAAMGRAGEDPDEGLRVLDTELEATIKRLTRVRAELAVIRRHRATADTPPGFEPFVRDLTDTQRSMLMMYSTIFSEAALEEFSQALAVRDDTAHEFEYLSVDADESTIDQLAERMVPIARKTQAEQPTLVDPTAHSRLGKEEAQRTMAQALIELYNPAQLRVLKRLDDLLKQERAAADAESQTPDDADTQEKGDD